MEFSVCSCWFGGCGFVGVFVVWVRVGLCLVDLVVLCVGLSVDGFVYWWFARVCGFILIVLVIRCGGSCVASCWVDYGVCILCLRTC